MSAFHDIHSIGANRPYGIISQKFLKPDDIAWKPAPAVPKTLSKAKRKWSLRAITPNKKGALHKEMLPFNN